jgi:alkanesulfonate monooxygenase SsuD/methylene tetrahydromethanopterin reductase-like flavin-dependent oxidoreductase (luciferase family)
MKFGLLVECHVREGQTQTVAFDETLAIVDAADSSGLDAIWVVEHHFRPKASVLSAPMAVAGAIASRTEKLRIGTAVQVLPLGNPIRIAEEASTIDHISHGRFDFGVGRSGITKFYDGFNIPYAESPGRFTEALEIILRAFTHDTFSYEGEYYAFHDVSVSPRPLQKPHPPIYMAVRTLEGFVATAKRGFPLIQWFMGDYHEEAMKTYIDTWHEAGHAGEPEIQVRVPMYIAPTESAAREDPKASVFHDLRRIIEESKALKTPERTARAEYFMNNYEEFLRTRVVYGTPKSVVERFREFKERMGLTGFILDINYGGQIPQDKVMNSIRLLAEEVAPEFR